MQVVGWVEDAWKAYSIVIKGRESIVHVKVSSDFDVQKVY